MKLIFNKFATILTILENDTKNRNSLILSRVLFIGSLSVVNFNEWVGFYSVENLIYLSVRLRIKSCANVVTAK